MIIIADSGSTKTDWIIIDGRNQVNFETKGINPFFLDEQFVIEEIKSNFPKGYSLNQIEEVYFYGPGCSTEERCNIVNHPIKAVFNNAKISIESDLLAAARAVFQKKRGIVCILGTGSNSGLYNGSVIVDNIRSTGYILGDEGSGANLGLTLIKQFLNQQLSKNVEDLFISNFNLTVDQIIDKIYRQDYPNRFLASLAPFLKQNIHIPEINRIVEKSFLEFFDWHVLPYQNVKNESIVFVGSISVEFKDQIEFIAKSKGLRILKYLKNPIQELAYYHQM